MEVSLDKGFPEAILFCLDGRILHQDPDYESFLFEGNMCHKYGYFVKDHLKTQAPWAYQADLQSAQQSSDQNQFKTVTCKKKKQLQFTTWTYETQGQPHI